VRDARVLRPELGPHVRRVLHERGGPVDGEDPLGVVGEHQRSQRPEPLPALHFEVDEVLHVRPARVGEDAAVAQRPRSGLAAALVQADHPAVGEQVDDRARQVVGLLGDEVVRQRGDRGRHLVLGRLGAEEVVGPAEVAAHTEPVHQAVEGAADGRAAVVRARRDEHVRER